MVGLKLGYYLVYDINGTVTKVDANSITVSNFLTTTTEQSAAVAKPAENVKKVLDILDKYLK